MTIFTHVLATTLGAQALELRGGQLALAYAFGVGVDIDHAIKAPFYLRAVGFRDKESKYPGLPCSDMSKDQKEGLQKVLLSLIQPYRKEDQEEVLECLKKQGGLDKCALAFYQEGDIGDDGEWDNWRLEGPAFVWYFRGHPHVHIWINVADDPSVPLNSQNF